MTMVEINNNDGTKTAVGFLTDPTGKPSDTRLKSWILFIFSLIIAIIILLMFGFDKDGATIEDYQVPFFLFAITFVGGISWQLLGKALEIMSEKRIK
jgi:hypothetical protein